MSDCQSVLTLFFPRTEVTGSEILLGSHFAYGFSLSVLMLSGDALYSQCKLYINLSPGTGGENNRIRH